MKHALFISAFLCAFAVTQASAACVVEYKAKRDNPLRLDHGTITVPGDTCSSGAVQAAVKDQLASQGWILLSILSVRQSG